MIAYKKLGMLLLKEGHTAEAKKSLEKYMSFNPRKRDKEMIGNILKTLR